MQNGIAEMSIRETRCGISTLSPLIKSQLPVTSRMIGVIVDNLGFIAFLRITGNTELSSKRGVVPMPKKVMNLAASATDPLLSAVASAMYTIPHGINPFRAPATKLPYGLAK